MSLKVFAYHGFNNGAALYRILQPYDALAQLPGFDVDRLPDEAEKVIVPLAAGESNVPGLRSHAQVAEWADVIVNQYRGGLRETARMICQGQMMINDEPVRSRFMVLDIDDDILHVQPDNPVYKVLMAGRKAEGKLEEVTPENEADLLERMEAEGGAFGEMDGRRFYFKLGQDDIENILDQVAHADLVTVSNKALQNLYRQYNPNVVVVPNCIRFDHWPANRQHDDGLVRLGLFGSNSHVRDWQTIAPVIKKLLAELPQLRLCTNLWRVDQGNGREGVYTPDYFEDLVDHPQVEWFEPCAPAEWASWLADKGVDIMLAPLVHTTFNKSRSNLRWLEASALGVPGVFENYDPFGPDVDHGVNGFLAKNPAEWERSIRRLALEPQLRAEMGAAARADAAAKYDQFKMVAQLGDLLTKKHEEFLHQRYMRGAYDARKTEVRV